LCQGSLLFRWYLNKISRRCDTFSGHWEKHADTDAYEADDRVHIICFVGVSDKNNMTNVKLLTELLEEICNVQAIAARNRSLCLSKNNFNHTVVDDNTKKVKVATVHAMKAYGGSKCMLVLDYNPGTWLKCVLSSILRLRCVLSSILRLRCVLSSILKLRCVLSSTLRPLHLSERTLVPSE
jgi:hypothetical protein